MTTLLPKLALAAGMLLLADSAFAAEPPAPGTCHVGAYALADGTRLVVTPSDEPNLRYRRLDGVSGKLFPTAEGRYEGGEGWSVREPVIVRAQFGACGTTSIAFQQGAAPAITGQKIAQPIIPISFKSGAETLYGELVLPAAHKPKAVVVVQYGSGQDSAVANNYVQYLLPLKDVATFVFDKRGTGRSAGIYTAEFGELSDDMVAAVAAVRARPEVKGAPLGLMGESQGGWVAPLAATKTKVDFVVASYSLAVSPTGEDREEVLQSLHDRGFGKDAETKALALHKAAMVIANSRFSQGMEEFARLKDAYRNEPWFDGIGGDFTGTLASTPPEKMDELKAYFSFAIDLNYEPRPVLAKVQPPMLWVLAGLDTEAPHETTLAVLRGLQAEYRPIDVAVFPKADHGIIEQGQGAKGRIDLGRHAPGYFDLLGDWMVSRKLGPSYGEAVLYPRR